MLRQEAGIQVDKFYPPTDWQDSNNEQIDIRKNAENNTIVLLVGHSADFTKYSLLGLLADTSSGTYDVYIDDVLVGSGVTKNTQYDIDFSTINTSYGSATTPEALILHKVVVKPTTSGEKISYFRFARTNGVTTQQTQGVLWIHFELDNKISLYTLTNNGSQYYNLILMGVTSKGDIINTSDMESCFRGAKRFSMLPLFKSDGSIALYNSFGQAGINRCKRIRYDTMQDITDNTDYSCVSAANLEQYCIKKRIRVTSNAMSALYKLKMLPKIYHPTSTNIVLSEMSALYPTKLDFSDISNMLICRTYGTSSYPMRGLRGLKVSNEAPFTGSSPQINVAYTGLDRDALRELFTSLPYNVGYTMQGNLTENPTGVFSGFSADDYLSLPSFAPTGSWEVNIKLKTGDSLINHVKYIFGNFNEQRSIVVGTTDNPIQTFKAFISTNGGVSFNIQLVSDVEVYTNTEYYLRFGFTGSKYYLDFSTDGINYVGRVEYSSTGKISPYILYFGRVFSTRHLWNGSIDMNNTYIKTDNVYWFRGQAQTTKILSLVGATGTAYLTEEDKAIALNKGWSLTLS